MGFIASNNQDLFSIFYPLVSGTTPIQSSTGFVSGSQDLKYIFRNVADGGPASFDTGFVTGGQDLRYVFAAIGSIATPTPTPTPSTTPTNTGTYTPSYTYTYTPNTTPTPTPTYTITQTPGVTYTPTPTPNVSISLNESNIFYGDTVHINTTASDNGTNIVPSTHNIQVRSGISNPPTSTYTDAITTTPTSSTDVITSRAYTPSDGANYYQFRSYADYGAYGRIYSPDSSVILAQSTAVTFEFTHLHCEGSPMYDDNNALQVGFVTNGSANITITIDPALNSFNCTPRTPVIVWGSMVQDFIIDNNYHTYNVSVGQGAHYLVVSFRGFSASDISVDIQWNSGSKFVNGSCRCVNTASSTLSLLADGVTSGATWYSRERNCTAGTNVDGGPYSNTSGTITSTNYGTTNIGYIVVQGSAPTDTPSLSPTTQTPVDMSGASCYSAAWVRDTSVNVYDGRVSYSSTDDGLELLNGSGTVDATGGSKGTCVGAWVDLYGSGSSDGSAPYSVLSTSISFTMSRPNCSAGDYSFSLNNSFSQSGIKADQWFSGVVFIKDRNNSGWGWFFPSTFGGNSYPFHVYTYAWSGWGNSNTVSLYRTSGNGINGDGTGSWSFSGPRSPNFDTNEELLIYGKLPSSVSFSCGAGGRITSSTYRNMAVWMGSF